MFDPKDITAYPVMITEKIRLSDTDRQGHVNNVAFSFFFEAGRAAIVLENEKLLSPDCFFVIVTTTIDFVGEIHYPGIVTISNGIERIGNSSLTVRQALFQNGRCASVSSSTMAQVNIAAKSSQPMSDEAKSALSAMLLVNAELN
ncbi:thioesterase family protein [Sphingorhabdus sp. EL138]|uniref:acyl-CoA thioesterase n=1 Tax=Sphingorhabdus sp. EL138 TaxID=2073156 RepID=UPI0025E2D61C|nr:thioesterase family protein [Sphingorhabdus sp. EL138]